MKCSSLVRQLAFRGIWLLLCVALLSACKRENNQVYYAPKETPPAQTVAPNPGDNGTPMAAPEATTLPALAWTLPDGWQEKPPGEMRAASFSVTGKDGQSADVSVIPLPIVGRDFELVNMWRQQVQLPPATDPDAVKQAEPVAIGTEQGRLFDLASEQPMIGKSRERILVAMLTRGTMSWFFKMTGEESFVASQKPGLIQFLKSVSFNESPAASPQPLAIPEAPAENSWKPAWTVPPDWQEMPPAEFLLAEYAIAGANGAKADVNVAMLNGEGGGLLPNVNRWRGQLGLEPLKNDMELAHVVPEMDLPGGGHLTIVDFTGVDSKTGKPARLVGAVVPQNGRTWFYKLMGDEQLVGQQKEAFVKFIQSAKYPNAP
jgi:hypothetical protein